MSKVKNIFHDPSLLECPCQSCLDDIRVMTSHYMGCKTNENALNRIALLVQVALALSIMENIVMAVLMLSFWLGWM